MIVRICLTIFIAVIFSACSTKITPEDDFIASLADTVWAGQEREIVLTTGTGAWFYADALGTPRRSVYGFYLLETKLFNNWELSDQSGVSLLESADYAVVHPEYCLRHYPSGVEERIECLPGADAIAITYKSKASTRTLFRLFSSDSNPDVSGNDVRSSNAIAGSAINTAIAFNEKPVPTTGVFSKNVDYPESDLIGEPGIQRLSSEREYTILSGKLGTCVFTASRDFTDARLLADSLLGQLSELREIRRQQSEAVLARFTFRCENREIERAFAWARLMLAGMVFDYKGESRLFAGFPESPYMDAFHSSLAGVGLILSDSSRSRAVKLFETILARQKPVDDVEFPSRLPTKITAESAEYISNTTAGALASQFDRVVSLSDAVPLGLPTKFLKSLDKAIGADLNSDRHVLGLMAGPGLFPDVGFPPRERHGALFETQALFGVARTYLATHHDAKSIEFEVPENALRGTSDWRYPYFPAFAVGLANKQFQMPLGIEAMMSRYRDRSWLWYDHLLIPEVANETLITPQMVLDTPRDSTQSVVPVLSVYWLEKYDKRIADRLIPIIEKNALTADRGLRSLSPNEAEFQSSHVYVYDNQPVNASLSGDVLVWTAGILADLYTITGRYDAATTLFDSLSTSLLHDGVVGGLPETLNGFTAEVGSNVGRNPLFASSLAEYIRIMYDDILGIDTKRPTYPGVKLVVPPDWGKVEFSFEAVGAIITLKRLDKELWSAEQTGSDDQIPLEVELWPETDVRGYGSLKLNPKMIVKFKVIPTTVGRYSLAWDEFPREQ